MKLSLGISPCPNDTFIFDAIANQRIDTEGLEFEINFADVEALNRAAFSGTAEVTKLSFFAAGKLRHNYRILTSGSALGKNCGPLVIGLNSRLSDNPSSCLIAIPGENTTANFLFSLAYPEFTQRKAMLFSEIEQAVLEKRTDAGVIIHENRFTYQQKGLKKIKDLGEFWETKTGLPIPLGCIAINRKFSQEIMEKVNWVIQRSVEYAFRHLEASADFVQCHAQEMNPEVTKKHIDLYVNNFSLRLGEEGKRAVERLFSLAEEKGLLPAWKGDLFV